MFDNATELHYKAKQVCFNNEQHKCGLTHFDCCNKSLCGFCYGQDIKLNMLGKCPICKNEDVPMKSLLLNKTLNCTKVSQLISEKHFQTQKAMLWSSITGYVKVRLLGDTLVHLNELLTVQDTFNNMIHLEMIVIKEIQEDPFGYSVSLSSINNITENIGNIFGRCFNCPGFLFKKENDIGECNLCNYQICVFCRTDIDKSESHVCKEEDVLNAKGIAEITKPCPKCCVPIEKSHGCFLMWCTNCHTTFDWNQYKIVELNGSYNHNPHYEEYMNAKRKEDTLKQNILLKDSAKFKTYENMFNLMLPMSVVNFSSFFAKLQQIVPLTFERMMNLDRSHFSSLTKITCLVDFFIRTKIRFGKLFEGQNFHLSMLPPFEEIVHSFKAKEPMNDMKLFVKLFSKKNNDDDTVKTSKKYGSIQEKFMTRPNYLERLVTSSYQWMNEEKDIFRPLRFQYLKKQITKEKMISEMNAPAWLYFPKKEGTLDCDAIIHAFEHIVENTRFQLLDLHDVFDLKKIDMNVFFLNYH
eukprot:Pgem_evm2s6026